MSVARMQEAGAKLGLAFQIQDDILDVTGSFEKLGKPIGSDAENEKATYVTFEGLEAAKKDVERLSGGSNKDTGMNLKESIRFCMTCFSI